ncbi:metal dependent phosphohydrolase [Paenibacillus mucilaginosus 3016]|uniref:Metal dependent phosphohydrolase n=2 Tax=Paenibacillus mucilaginosus TaxID=61624 RepID=H6NMQ0_9BACL|nr:HD domain-containing protein [Paenibacillus mucilaginosus]AFC30387.1 metal dependent phosphohydrolase [Paenibacillus mucilaginosus 3016]AFH62662.2 phosphohydrolase [Paenibacillus mucilaginosus K02]AFK65497.1 HD superfamily hydrolase [Paenibacillus mucilaginosus K02]WFA19024.1 HD domain-containing protein [Paenibacillus mucilaginosus]
MTLIRTFTEGDEITGYYLLKKAEIKQTNAAPPKNYFDFVLADSSGEIPAKLWDVSAADKETYFPMMLVKVQGLVQMYREKPQMKINRIRKATEEDGCKLTDFIKSAPIQPIDLVHIIKQTAAGIQDSECRSVVEFCISKVEERLMHYPAAKAMHHAYYAGLAYHICRMLELGEFVARQRPFLNPDLIKAGIILHDIAKPEEMNAELGIVTDYSLKGKLLGHISLAANWVIEAAIALGIDVSSENIVILQHLVLSHHNLGEWGSPVQPQIPEAIALHYIDTLDAKLQAVEDALDSLPDSEEWTQPLRIIENKPIFRMRK